MKNNIIISILAFLLFQGEIFAQFKVVNGGDVCVGTGTPWGKFRVEGQETNFSNGGHTIRFKPMNPHQEIGSNYYTFNFWYPANNGGWNNVYARKFYTVSDSTLKENITVIDDIAIDKLRQLNPVRYEFISTQPDSTDSLANPVLVNSDRETFGLLAQQVMSVYPEMVSSTKGILAIDYEQLGPLLVAGYKNQMDRLDSIEDVDSSLEARIAELEAIVATCCGGLRMNGHTNDNELEGTEDNPNKKTIELSNMAAIILDQNVPNPFAEQTTISYFIPEGISNAQILFFDNNGIVLKTVEIHEPGYGHLKIYAPNLSSGIYSYSILVDGKPVQTKKMVCTK